MYGTGMWPGGAPADGSTIVGATVVVAASDSKNVSRADFAATGSGDEQVIQQAIDALPDVGGRVLLLEGTYYMDGGVTLSDWGTTLQGQARGWGQGLTANPGTKIMAANPPDGTALVTLAGNYCSLRNLVVDGANFDGGGAIDVTGVSVTGGNTRIENCHIGFLSFHGVNVSGSMAFIRDCELRNTDVADVYLDGCHWTHLVGCEFEQADGRRLFANSGTTRCLIAGNTFDASAGGSPAVEISGSGEYNRVLGNLVESAAGSGMVFNAGSFCVVKDNVISSPQEHGIISNLSDSEVAGNVVEAPGQAAANTYDAINVASGSRSSYQGNLARPGANGRHGVFVAAGVADALVTNNDLFGSWGGVTVNDNGTGTITTAGNRT